MKRNFDTFVPTKNIFSYNVPYKYSIIVGTIYIWKVKNLSSTERLALAKSVIQPYLHTYVMQTTSLPRALCDNHDYKCGELCNVESESHLHVYTDCNKVNFIHAHFIDNMLYSLGLMM
jgi:hypothetical protein